MILITLYLLLQLSLSSINAATLLSTNFVWYNVIHFSSVDTDTGDATNIFSLEGWTTNIQYNDYDPATKLYLFG